MSQYDEKYSGIDEVLTDGSTSASENGIDTERDWSPEEEKKAKAKYGYRSCRPKLY
jgi:hypothetical protein